MSLNIEKKISDVNTIVLSGRLDTVTAPQLEAELEKILPGVYILSGTEGNIKSAKGDEHTGHDETDPRRRKHHGGF